MNQTRPNHEPVTTVYNRTRFVGSNRFSNRLTTCQIHPFEDWVRLVLKPEWKKMNSHPQKAELRPSRTNREINWIPNWGCNSVLNSFGFSVAVREFVSREAKGIKRGITFSECLFFERTLFCCLERGLPGFEARGTNFKKSIYQAGHAWYEQSWKITALISITSIEI